MREIKIAHNNVLAIAQGFTITIPNSPCEIKEDLEGLNTHLQIIQKTAVLLGKKKPSNTQSLDAYSFPFRRSEDAILESLDLVYHNGRIFSCHVRRFIEQKTYSLSIEGIDTHDKVSVSAITNINIDRLPLDAKMNKVKHMVFLWFNKWETLSWGYPTQPVPLNQLSTWIKISDDNGYIGIQRPAIYKKKVYLLTLYGYINNGAFVAEQKKTFEPK